MGEPDRLTEITEYYRAHPTPPPQGDGQGGQHIHVHHHYAPAAPAPPPPEPTRGKKLLDEMIPYIVLAIFAMIILTGCCVILFMFAAAVATIILSLVVGLIALAVCIATLAWLVRSMSEGRALNTLASKTPTQGRRKR